ncbi:hypothetical protein DXG01_017048 [Tephrocybe rancida]|nr:hypothetical protein DXG01_017048 [Tephrocybe rancida]
MPLPKKHQSAFPSFGFARSQFIFVVRTGSVAGARKSLPAQAQAFPKSQAVPKTPLPPNTMRVPASVSVSVSVAGSPPRAQAHVDEHDHVVAGCSGSAESDPRTPKSKDHLAIDDTPASCTIYCLSEDQLHFAEP